MRSRRRHTHSSAALIVLAMALAACSQSVERSAAGPEPSSSGDVVAQSAAPAAEGSAPPASTAPSAAPAGEGSAQEASLAPSDAAIGDGPEAAMLVGGDRPYVTCVSYSYRCTRVEFVNTTRSNIPITAWKNEQAPKQEKRIPANGSLILVGYEGSLGGQDLSGIFDVTRSFKFRNPQIGAPCFGIDHWVSGDDWMKEASCNGYSVGEQRSYATGEFTVTMKREPDTRDFIEWTATITR